MIDFHTHILYGIDDGCKTIEESINILKKYEKENIKHIVLTPHYIENSDFSANNEIKEEILKKLKDKIKEENINVTLYLGNEIYITDNILELIEKNEIKTINDSKYILVEFPFINESSNTSDFIHNLILSGYIPVIAHPERYEYFSDISKIDQLLNLGAKLQINKDSLFGKYGKEPKKIVKKLLKERKVFIVGSDIHHETTKIYKSKKFENKIKSLTDKKYCNEILYENGYDILNIKK